MPSTSHPEEPNDHGAPSNEGVAASRLDGDIFRHVIGHFASGVTVITSRSEGADYGSTASAVSSLSLDPPMLLVCLNESSATGQVVDRTGTFAVNILGEDQGDLALHFASRQVDKFAGVEVLRGIGQVPLLSRALAQLECRVVERATGGTHAIFLGEVLTARAAPGAPLTYFRGAFGRFVELRDDATYHELRTSILERSIPLDEVLDTDDLSARLGVDRGSVVQALARLSQDGLISRRGPSVFVITPVDETLLDYTLRAREALTIGVLRHSIEQATQSDVESLRRAADRTLPRGDDAEADHAAREAMRDFHEQVLALSHNPLILELHRRLSVSSILDRALQGVDWMHPQVELSRDFTRLADAVAAADIERAMEAVHRYTNRLLLSSRDAVRNAGGVV